MFFNQELKIDILTFIPITPQPYHIIGKNLLSLIFADSGGFDSAQVFAYTTFCAVLDEDRLRHIGRDNTAVVELSAIL